MGSANLLIFPKVCKISSFYRIKSKVNIKIPKNNDSSLLSNLIEICTFANQTCKKTKFYIINIK